MDYHWLPQAPCVCRSFATEVLETKPPTVRMTMSTLLHQERLQDGRNQSGPRGTTAMPSSGTHWKHLKTIETIEHNQIACLALYLISLVAVDKQVQNWQTLSSTCSSTSMSKLLSLTMLVGPGLLWVRSYSDVAWCCYIPNTFTKHSDARQWKPSKFEQLSDIHKERVLKNAVGVSKHDDHHWCHWGGSMIYSS